MAENRALLPTGMMDQMPDVAEAEAEACAKLQSTFANFGYRLVNPPMLEFEETLLAEGAGKALSTNTFRLMDPVSQRMMALRSDTTAQIARLAASRMKEAPRPLRIAYIADVLRIQSTQLRPERQFRQAGCEFIGTNKNSSTEISLLSLLALNDVGVQNITIDFTAPEIIRILSAKADQKEKIQKACERRDQAAFAQLGTTGKTLMALDDMSGPAENFISKNRASKLTGQVAKILDQLEAVIKDLQKALKIYGLDKKISITVDPIETRGFEYQSFPCFTLFAKGIRGELGRGGAYASQFGEQSEMACGFTLYMDSVLRALPVKARTKSLLISENVGWLEIKNLQSKGWKTVKCNGSADLKKAEKFGATHLFKDGKVKEI